MDINERLIKALNESKVLNKIGLAASRIILRRTRQGKDISGSSFKPYSKSYQKKKKKMGFADVTTVNLEASRVGSMLSAIDYETSFDSVILYFNKPAKEQLAYYHNISGAGKSRVIRKFWGIEMRDELDALTNLANKEAKEILKREIAAILTELNDYTGKY